MSSKQTMVLLKGSTTPMVDLDIYEFKYLNTGKTTPKEMFTNAYSKEVYYCITR